MCGIAGWVDYKKDLRTEAETMERMGATLAPRGPDDSGFWFASHAALAHRRLVVVDPVGGGQPMVRYRGGHPYVLVYNGELYNTAELRAELEQRGCVFHGHSDTEVLLAAYMEWGADCLGRLNGIFAFAVWDEAEQTLFMARDRLGVKPLFYARRGSSFIFGSELKAVLAHPSVPAELDVNGLAEIFVIGPARTPGGGVFRGVCEVKAGWCLAVTPHGDRLRQYWRLQSRPHQETVADTADHVRELLRDTVERQLVSDVPLGVLLSGGLDSSAVAAFAARYYEATGRGVIDTFSVDYVGNDQNFRANEYQPNADGPWITVMCEALQTRHHGILVDTAELVEALKTAVLARDLPGMADVDASLYLFSRAIKEQVTVALSGEAADEIFGGYPWFRDEVALKATTFPWVRQIEARAALLKPETLGRLDPFDYVAERYTEAMAEVPRLPGEEPYDARMREMLYLNMTRFMPILLDRKDRMSMRVGLEVRVPYCDHRLVEYVWNIPWQMKRTGGVEKGILREGLRGVLPEEVRIRKKSPYPKTHNPAFVAAAGAWLEESLNDKDSPLRPLVNEVAVRDVIHTGAANFNPAWFSQLMGGAQLLAYLAQVNFWLREYRVTLV